MVGMPGRILLVEDDPAIRAQTATILRDDGYQVDEAADGAAALTAFDRRAADCVLLDLMLPDIDGFEVCRRLRARSGVPIIMVSARDDSFDVVAGLEAGADDYVTKPFVPKELTARIRATLRRAHGLAGERGTIRLGDRVEISADEGVVHVEGQDVHLTRTEFRLLCELASHPGRVMSRELLLERVWGYEYVADTKLVDVHVYRLRAKIESDPSNPVHLVTVRGLGYKAVA